MSRDVIRSFVTRKPGWVVSIWLAQRGCRLSFPNLTRLAAEGRAKMLAAGAESRRAPS